jgi:hypothetical protein
MYRFQINKRRISQLFYNNATGSNLRQTSTNLNKQQVSTPSNQNHQRMNQLHYERNNVVNNQTAHKSKGKKIYNVFKANKDAFKNIAIGFFGTLMALQVAGLRSASRRLEQELTEKECELREKKAILKSLSGDDFVLSLVRQIEESEIKNTSSTNKVNFLGGYSNPKLEPKDSSESLKLIIQEALQQHIGDVVLSEEEKHARDLAKLLSSSSPIHDDQISNIIEVKEVSNGQQMVKSRKFIM